MPGVTAPSLHQHFCSVVPSFSRASVERGWCVLSSAAVLVWPRQEWEEWRQGTSARFSGPFLGAAPPPLPLPAPARPRPT